MIHFLARKKGLFSVIRFAARFLIMEINSNSSAGVIMNTFALRSLAAFNFTFAPAEVVFEVEAVVWMSCLLEFTSLVMRTSNQGILLRTAKASVAELDELTPFAHGLPDISK